MTSVSSGFSTILAGMIVVAAFGRFCNSDSLRIMDICCCIWWVVLSNMSSVTNAP